MTTVGTRRDFVRYGAAVFDAPLPRNASNVFEQTTFSGTVEMTRVGIRYIRRTDYPGKYCTLLQLITTYLHRIYQPVPDIEQYALPAAERSADVCTGSFALPIILRYLN